MNKEYISGKVGVIEMKGNKTTEDWLPIKSITNGSIVLDDGMMVTGVKIEPKNILCDDFSMKMYQICKNCQSYKQENPFPEYNDCETHKIKVSDYGTCPDFKIKSDK